MAPLKKEIQICMGSSCFSRGNREALEMIQRYLREHALEEEVILRGSHCFSNCSEGPNLKVAGKVYTHVSRDNILEIMEMELGELKTNL